MMKRVPHTRVPPPVYALAAGVAQGLAARGRRPSLTSGVLGAGVAAASAAVAISATRLFHARGTTEMPLRPEEATVLVADGPFRHTRNPMYLSLAGMLTGHAIARRSPAALLPVAAFVALVDRVQVSAEEAALAAKFGEEYAAYTASVPRWIGR